MFEYALPDSTPAAPKKAGGDKPDDDKKKDEPKKDDDKGKPVRTQMIGEKPGDDLGYDPKKIPVEPIPD